VNSLVAILGLGVLIFVHEAGHFFVARAVGMRPRKFYIGFPPALVKKQVGETEYGLGSIPLGGYVKIPGMHRPAPADLDVHMHRALEEAPQLVSHVDRVKRALAAADHGTAEWLLPGLSAAVEEAELSEAARRGAERGVNDLADALSPDAYWRQATWRRAAAIFAGPATNVVFAIILFAALFMAGGGKATRTIDETVPGAPAAQAGLRSGDAIVSINGARVTADTIPDRIRESEGKPLTLVVERAGDRRTVGPVQARQEDGGDYRLGFVLRGRGLAPPEAVWQSLRLTGLVTKEIGASLGRLVTGEGRKDISSPVGIVRGSSDALDKGVQDFFWVLGLISLSLALLNLLPLLPLDGGHILFSIIEGLRGKAVGREVYERVSAIGLALVLLLFFIGLSNDIGNLGSG
jgi:regulator of sigma E protease